MAVKFYVCPHCGNVIQKVVDSKVPVVCCGVPMQELVPNTVDASNEKHVPVVTRENGKLIVNVGSVDHPMLDAHYIQWVALVTDNSFRVVNLEPGQKPHVEVAEDEKVNEVYEYCNLHGLWKTEL